MIVFINPEKQLIKLYSQQGIEDFEFDEVDELAEKIGKKRVLYVTGALDCSASQIVTTVNALIAQSGGSGASDASGMNLDTIDSQTLYIQSCKSGILHVQDINVTFEGPGDCKLIDPEMAQLIQESQVLRALLKKSAVKIVDYATMKKAARKQNKHKEKFRKIRQEAMDSELDSIIIKSDKKGSAEAIAAGMFSGDASADDIQSSDITDFVMNDPTEGMSEEEIAEAMRRGEIE